MKDKTSQYIEKLSKMIAEPTFSSESENDVGRFSKYQEVLKELFPNLFKTFKLEIFHGSILLSYIVESDKLPILLMSHQDVVEPNGNWIHDPFKPVVENNRLYGRGALDTKGNFFAIAQSIEELLTEGYKFNRSIYIESSCNEEGSQKGMKEIVSVLKNRGIEFDFVMDEGGVVVDNPFVKDGGKMAMIALCEKGCMDIKFTYKNNGGHSSTPSKNTPLVVLSKMIVAVNKYNGFKKELSDTTLETLKVVSKTSKGVLKFLFKHSHGFKHLLTFIFNRLSPITRAMTQTTVCFTKIHGSEMTNVIPEEAYVIANCRISQKEGVESTIKKLTKIANKYGVTCEPMEECYLTKETSHNSEQYKYLVKCINKFFPNIPVAPYVATGASDSKYADQISKNVFRFAPFTLDNQQLNSIHSIEENVNVNDLVPAVEFYMYLIKELY